MVYKLAPPTYKASGSLVLFNPLAPPTATAGRTTSTTLDANNPFARFNDLSVVVDIMVREMSSSQVGQQLQAAGLHGSYTVGANLAYYTGPVLDISTQAGTPDAAKTDIGLVMAEFQKQLAAQQARYGTSPEYFITAQPIVIPTTATKVFSSTLRRLIAVGVLDTLLLLGLAALVDSVAWHLKARRIRATPHGPVGITAPEAVDEPDSSMFPSSANILRSDHPPQPTLAVGVQTKEESWWRRDP
jgi:hypothetical protein